MAAVAKAPNIDLTRCAVCYERLLGGGPIYRLEPCGHHIDKMCQRFFVGFQSQCRECLVRVTDTSCDFNSQRVQGE